MQSQRFALQELLKQFLLIHRYCMGIFPVHKKVLLQLCKRTNHQSCYHLYLHPAHTECLCKIPMISLHANGCSTVKTYSFVQSATPRCIHMHVCPAPLIFRLLSFGFPCYYFFSSSYYQLLWYRTFLFLSSEK